MQNVILKKGLVIGIIFLFIGASTISKIKGHSIKGDTEETSNYLKVNNFDDEQTEYWALIVIVNEYAEHIESYRPLMLDVLENLYNIMLKSEIWDEDHIKIIKGKDATRANIIKGLKWLDKMEDENDFSLIYFFAHGFKIGFDFPPFDEIDRNDEALTNYWSFDSVSFILDNEFNLFLNRLESKGVCFIVESCYAGGFDDVNNYFKFNKNLFKIINRINNLNTKEWMEDFGEVFKGQNRIVILSSREDESSTLGEFCYPLIDALRGYADYNIDYIISAEEVFRYIQPRCFRQSPIIYDNFPGELPLIKINNTNSNYNNDKFSYYKNIYNESNKNKINTKYNYENFILSGYIKDEDTNNSIYNAEINITYLDVQGNFGFNNTNTDSYGFYRIYIPLGRFKIRIHSEKYCSDSTITYEIEKNQNYWFNFSLKPRPKESCYLSGYIKNIQSGDPIENAKICLYWNYENISYWNETYTDLTGFYSMNVAPGKIKIEATNKKYFTESTEEFEINEFENMSINFSLYTKPTENSIVCGYINDVDTGEHINNANVFFEWIDNNLNYKYYNTTKTDSAGFYRINLAAGEIYPEIWAEGYKYKYEYRKNLDENITLLMNVTLNKEKLEIDIRKPLKAIYVNNKMILPNNKTIIFGEIDIQTSVYSERIWPRVFENFFWPGDSELWWLKKKNVTKIELLIDGILKETAYSEPYIFKWDEKKIGRHNIKIIAYDNYSVVDSEEFDVFKIF